MVRKEIVRNGSTVPGMTEIGTDWRVVDGVATAWFDRAFADRGGCAGRAHRELSAEIVVDLRATGVRVAWTQRSTPGPVSRRAGSRAGRVTCCAAAAERGVESAKPVCGEAVLAARASTTRLGRAAVWRIRAARPAVRIRQSSEPRPLETASTSTWCGGGRAVDQAMW